MALSSRQDAFGHALRAFLDGRTTSAVVERDDGYVEADPLRDYFARPRRWPAHQKRALRLARGRVLDIGCGAGRHALHLQERGLDVVATDVSPGAVAVCRARGLRNARLVAATRIPREWGPFDTVLLLGNNFGLVENPVRARWLLGRLHRLTSGGARILAETIDPGVTDKSVHRRYQKANRARGRMRGQIRLRVRWEDHATPWFDYLLVSRREMASLLRGTGWKVERVIASPGRQYVAVLEKTRR